MGVTEYDLQTAIKAELINVCDAESRLRIVEERFNEIINLLKDIKVLIQVSK